MPSEPPHQSLSATLQRLQEAAGPGTFTLGEVLRIVGDRGFGLLLVIISLPSALPLPAAGYSVPFGLLLFALGIQMILGKPSPTLPAFAEKRTFPSGMLRKMAGGGIWMFSKIEWLIRPRMRWVGSRGGRVFMGALVLVMATLMMIPIPSTNTAPAAVIFLIGVGLTEEDGLFVLGACVLGVLAVLLYAVIIIFFVQFITLHGWDAVGQFTDWLRSLLSPETAPEAT